MKHPQILPETKKRMKKDTKSILTAY